MDESQTPAAADPTAENNLPPGSHALEVGARRGIGPLSPHGGEVWHGHALPCVSCGQLVPRDASECDQCAQDLTPAMLEKMRAHAGPWYVLEHIRPFPGVSLERIVRQINRGLITETSIVRGPSTDYQWRFAVETPGLCRYFGRCWSCHEAVSASDGYCRHCLSYLSFEKPRATPDASPAPTAVEPKGVAMTTATLAPNQSPERERRVPEATGQPAPAKTPLGATSVPAPAETPSDHLKDLSAVVDRTALPMHEPIWDEPPRIGGIRATWIAAVLLAIVIVALMFLTQSRSDDAPPRQPAAPGMILTPP